MKRTGGYETRNSGSTKQPESNLKNGNNKSLSVNNFFNISGLNLPIKRTQNGWMH